ncbi:MAG: hypothetical protein ACTSU5_01015, partial [Promethearchaeota archaeon]
MPSGLENNAHRPVVRELTLEFPDRPECPHCHKPKRVRTRSKPRVVVDLAGNVEVTTTYYQCGNPFCEGRREPYERPE